MPSAFAKGTLITSENFLKYQQNKYISNTQNTVKSKDDFSLQ